jgi:hypothetical protein
MGCIMSNNPKHIVKDRIVKTIALSGRNGITHADLTNRFRNRREEFNEMMVVLFLGNALIHSNGRLFLNDSNDEIYKFLKQHSLE